MRDRVAKVWKVYVHIQKSGEVTVQIRIALTLFENVSHGNWDRSLSGPCVLFCHTVFPSELEISR